MDVNIFYPIELISRFKSSLTRKTSSTNFIPVIDGFRFFAIITVVFYHLNTHFSRLISPQVDKAYFEDSFLFSVMREGGIGVDVFFAISGFILALPFAKQHLFGSQRVSIKGYFTRRLTRLEPPYVISLTLLLVVHIFILGESFREMMPHYLASFFYVHGFVYDEWSRINPVAWSLEVEVQFYILAPLLAMVFKIPCAAQRRAAIVSLILLCLVHRNFNYEWMEQWHLRKSLVMHLHEFLIGFLVADLFLVTWKASVSRSWLWDLLGVAAMASLLIWNDPLHFDHDLIFSASLFVAFVSVFRGSLLNRFYSNDFIVIVGGMCYTIYLLHYALIAFLAGWTESLFHIDLGYASNYWLQAVVILPLVLLVCAVFFVLIERPCMDKNWPGKLKAKIISIFA